MEGSKESWLKRFFSRRSLVTISLVTVGSAALVAALLFSLHSFLEKKVATEFRELNGTFGAIQFDLFNRSIKVENIIWQTPNQRHPHEAVIKRCGVVGIDVFQLIFRGKIHARQMLLDSGSIYFNQRLKIAHTDSSAKEFLIEIEKFIIKNVFVDVRQDSVTKFQGLLNITVGAFASSHKTLASCKLGFHELTGSTENLLINNGHFYNTKVKKIRFNSEDGSLTMDSVILIPLHAKYKFARMLGRQADRMDLSVKKVEIAQLNYWKLFDRIVSIGSLTITEANLLAFRDKRIDTGIEPNVPMPIDILRKLPFAIAIDTVNLVNSKVTVEEFPINGIRPGHVYFDQLNARLLGLNNRYTESTPHHANLLADGRLMGTGLVQAAFTLPLDGSQDYHTVGSLTNFQLADLNPVLENVANLRVQTGHLKKLRFDFRYSEFKSKGTLEINYKDLKLQVLKANKEKSEKFLMTIILNSMVKDTKDNSVDRDERTGVIEVERNRKKFITNLWWKSIFSGLKASFAGKSGNSVQHRIKK